MYVFMYLSLSLFLFLLFSLSLSLSLYLSKSRLGACPTIPLFKEVRVFSRRSRKGPEKESKRLQHQCSGTFSTLFDTPGGEAREVLFETFWGFWGQRASRLPCMAVPIASQDIPTVCGSSNCNSRHPKRPSRTKNTEARKLSTGTKFTRAIAKRYREGWEVPIFPGKRDRKNGTDREKLRQ